jgi:hypothetical protein
MRGIIVLAEPGQCVSLVIPQLLLTDRFRLPFHSSQSPADTALGIGSIALVVPSSHAIAGILAFLYDLIKDCDCILTLAHCDQFISHVDQQFNVAIQVVFMEPAYPVTAYSSFLAISMVRNMETI